MIKDLDMTGAAITAPVQTDVYTTASCQRLTNTPALQRERQETLRDSGTQTSAVSLLRSNLTSRDNLLSRSRIPSLST